MNETSVHLHESKVILHVIIEVYKINVNFREKFDYQLIMWMKHFYLITKYCATYNKH